MDPLRFPERFEHSSVIPTPPPFDVDARLRELQEMIDNPNTKEDQKPNLRVAIELYHTGKMPGPMVMIQDGKVIHRNDLHPRSSWWAEGIAYQLSSDGPAVEVPQDKQVAKTRRHKFPPEGLSGFGAPLKVSPN